MSCARWHDWIDRGFAGGLSPRVWRRLAAHLATCEACRARFERLEALAPPSKIAPPLSDDAVDRIAREVLDASAPAIDAMAPARRRWLWAGAGLTAAAAAAVAVIFLIRPNEPELRPRGGVQVGERTPGARLHCVAGDRVQSSVHAAPLALPAPRLRCTLDAALQITYSAPSLEGWSMVAFSRDSSGRRFDYAPGDDAGPALAIEPDVRDRLLDRSTRLGVRHAPGAYDVRIRFFDHAVSAADGARDDAAPAVELRAEMILEGRP